MTARRAVSSIGGLPDKALRRTPAMMPQAQESRLQLKSSVAPRPAVPESSSERAEAEAPMRMPTGADLRKTVG
jgi:hypothetical protein